jgi:glucan phosphorylase
MNEGHAAFLTLERVGGRAHDEGLTFDEAREFVRATTMFTTHTPVPAGHDRFGEDLMRRYFSDATSWVGVPWERFMSFGQAEGDKGTFNMTYLALNFASFANGVSRCTAWPRRSSCARSGRACWRARCRSTRS